MLTHLVFGTAFAGVLITTEGAELTLDSTTVHADISAGVAVVDVTQHFTNPFNVPIDADYVLPLPEMAAVRSMRLSCGDREIHASIASKEEAARRYEAARREGRKAALLEQQRTNVFTWRVASICPGEDVDVSLQYVDEVTVVDGHMELHFPTTMGARFDPADLEEPDLVLPPLEPRQLAFTVSLDEGMPVESVWSDSHDIAVRSERRTGLEVGLHPQDTIPNKDVHLAWSLAGANPRASMVVDRHAEDEGTFTLTLQPQVLKDAAWQRPRELLFVLDASGSMSGVPWDTAKAAVFRILEDAGPDDTFNLVRYSSDATAAFDVPQRISRDTVAEAHKWLERRGAGGGTRMGTGISYALGLPTNRPEAMRLVLLMTDGYIGRESDIMKLVDERLGDARMFSLGVGSSVNRMLLEGVAWAGRGDALYQLPNTPLEETSTAFHRRIRHPAMTDLVVDFGDLEVSDVHPKRVPDLWAGQPIRVTGRFRGSGVHEVRVTGQVERESWTLRAPLDLGQAPSHEAVTQLWARRAIESLAWQFDEDPQLLAQQGEALALEHHLVSTWTSLIAEDDVPSACGPGEERVGVPLYSPQGVDPAQMSARTTVVGPQGWTVTESYGGVGSLGARGSGLGGGGTSSGISGLIGAKGIGSGTSGYGAGGGSFGAVAKPSPVVAGAPTIIGSLDKSLVDEVIRRHANQLRYCYQRELTKHPSLTGLVKVQFTIAADGTVAQAEIRSSTLNNEAVESCLIGRFKALRFTPPSGGGVVVITYPLKFSP